MPIKVHPQCFECDKCGFIVRYFRERQTEKVLATNQTEKIYITFKWNSFLRLTAYVIIFSRFSQRKN